MTAKPLVTVITSFYNEEAHISAAIDSILRQTYANFEFILVDDYSTDRSLEICRSFRDPRIRVHVKTDEPKYLAASRNIGVRMAKGQYVIFQDADDVSEPDRIRKQLAAAMEAPGRRVVGCWVRRVENGRTRIVELPVEHEDIIQGFHRAYRRTTIVAGTILSPRRLLLEVPYRQQLRYMQDWDHLLRLHENDSVVFYNYPEPLYTYFIRSKGVLNKPEWLDYNVFVRHCQRQRRLGRAECETLDAFLQHLDENPTQKLRWLGLRELIRVKGQLSSNPILGRLL